MEGEVTQVSAVSERPRGLLSLPQPSVGAPSFHGGSPLVPGRALPERYSKQRKRHSLLSNNNTIRFLIFLV